MNQNPSIDYLLRHVADTLGQQLDQVVQEQIGIGLSQYKILWMLGDNPAIRQRQIADLLGQTEASISRQVKIMLDKGLLISTINPKNRRERHSTLTPKGARTLESADAAIQHHTTAMFGSLDEKQNKQLAETLAVLHAWTCQPGKQYACAHLTNIA